MKTKMKNLKLIIAALTIVATVLITNAKEGSKEPNSNLQLASTYFELPFNLEKEACDSNSKALSVSPDLAMLEAYDLLNEEEDSPLDFNTNDYLPENFNAYSEDEAILVAHELLNEEADAPFDFDTSDYLPTNFYAVK